jgi:hypothetical protein
VLSIRSLWRAHYERTNFNGFTVAYKGEDERAVPKWLADFVQERAKLSFEEFFIELNQWLAEKWLSISREFINQRSKSILKDDNPDIFNQHNKRERMVATVVREVVAETTEVDHRVAVAEVTKPRKTKTKKGKCKEDTKICQVRQTLRSPQNKQGEEVQQETERGGTGKEGNGGEQASEHIESDDPTSRGESEHFNLTNPFTHSDDLKLYCFPILPEENNIFKWRKIFGATREDVFTTDKLFSELGISTAEKSKLGSGASCEVFNAIIEFKHVNLAKGKATKDKEGFFFFSERVVMKKLILSRQKSSDNPETLRFHQVIERFLCRLPLALRHFFALPVLISKDVLLYPFGTFPRSRLGGVISDTKSRYCLDVAEVVAMRMKKMLLYIFYMSEGSEDEQSKKENIVFKVCTESSCLFGRKFGFCAQAIDFDHVKVDRNQFIEDLKIFSREEIISKKIKEALELPLPLHILKGPVWGQLSIDPKWINRRLQALFDQEKTELRKMLNFLYIENEQYFVHS